MSFHTIDGFTAPFIPIQQLQERINNLKLQESTDIGRLDSEKMRNAIADNLRKPDFYKGKDLAHIAMKTEKLQCSDYLFIHTLRRTIWCSINEDKFFDGEDLSNIISSFLNLTCNDWGFLHSLKGAIYNNLHVPNFFNGTNLSDIALAFSKIGSKYKRFLNTLRNCIDRVKSIVADGNLDLKEFDNCVRGLRNFGCEDGDIEAIINIIKLKLEDLDNPGSYNIDRIADFTDVFDGYECEDRKATKALVECVMANIYDNNFFTPYDLAKITCAFATFGVRDKSVVDFLVDTMKYHLPDLVFLGTGELADITLAFAKLECKDNELIEILARRIKPNLKRWKGDDCYFDDIGLTNIAWSFVKFEYKDSLFIQALIDHIATKLPENGSLDLSIVSEMIAVYYLGVDKLEHHKYPTSLDLSNFAKIKIDVGSSPRYLVPESSRIILDEYLGEKSQCIEPIMDNSYLLAGNISDIDPELLIDKDIAKMALVIHLTKTSLRITILENS